MKKSIANILYIIFMVAFLLLFLYKMYLRNKGLTEDIKIVNYLMYSFIAASVIVRVTFRFFPNWYKDKTTGEDL
ncbi:MAG: hypothetical protein ACKVOW_20630 [Chitinophagaceae bacterium]